MSGARGLRWPHLACTQLAGLLLAALLAGLGLLAVRAVPELTAGGGVPPASSTSPPAMTSGVLPQAALGPVSAVLGAAEPSYHVRSGSAGARAVNRTQGFSASFTTGGVRVSSRSLALALRATAAGFGASPAALAPARPLAASNRVTYDRPGLQEWYANGPFGLEQGFTVARPAASQRDGVYTVSMALSGTNTAALAQEGRSVALRTASGATLRYGGLRAVDAGRRLLPSWLSLHGRTLSLHVRTAGARFPVSIDPVLTGEGLIIELGQAEGEAPEKPAFGSAVALSGDGTTALVGAPDGESHSGAAWVFHREGAVWSQQGKKLVAAAPGEEGSCEGEAVEGEEAASCAFGRSVALSGNGNIALIGAPRSGAKAGLAWVFNRSGETWTRESSPLEGASDPNHQNFGFSVALSREGGYALVGAPTEHGGKGEAYMFERVEGTWSEAIPLVASGEGSGGHLGFSVALSADGQEAIAGAPLDGLHKGSAFVFEHEGNSWSQNGGPLTGVGEVGEGRFGETVAMSGNGNVVLIGAPAERGKRGSVWTFVSANSKWLELPGSRLSGIGNEKEEFGRGLALSEEGDHALIGAPRASTQKAGEQAGAAWVYEAAQSSWTVVLPVLEASLVETGHGQFAKSVSMTENAQTILIGAPHETFKAGAVWLFGQRPTVEEVQSPVGGKGNPKGRLSGDNKVLIVGKNLTEALAVWFGPNKALEIVERVGAPEFGAQEKLVVVAPPGNEAGEVDITVEAEDWLSAVNTNDQYTYVRGPGEEPKEGRGGGGGQKNKHLKNGEIPIGQLTGSGSTGTGTSGKGGTGIGNVSGVTSASSRPCRVFLRSSKIQVATHARAMISLAAKGTGRCGGHLGLQVSVKSGRHTKTRTIASGTYVATAGHNLTVALKLGSTGQALLRTGHGHLRARLLIGRTSPTVLKASAFNVTLSNAKKKR